MSYDINIEDLCAARKLVGDIGGGLDPTMFVYTVSVNGIRTHIVNSVTFCGIDGIYFNIEPYSQLGFNEVFFTVEDAEKELLIQLKDQLIKIENNIVALNIKNSSTYENTNN